MIDAVVISINEPQLDRTLKAVNEQTIPFKKVIHVNGIVPENEAVNRALEIVDSEWVMKVDGDTILYPNAHEIVKKYMNGNGRVCGYYFGLRDTFMDCDIGFCGVLKTKLYQTIKRKDKMNCDLNVNIELRKQGWIIKKFLQDGIIVGTHFDNPDEFQVFGRFYRSGKRADNNTFEINQLTGLLKKTGNPLYQLALNAIQFAKEKNRYYIGSRNVDFDRKLFEEFKGENNNQSATKQA